MATVKASRSTATAKKSSAGRTLKALGKRGSIRVSEIRAAVRRVSAKR